MRAFHELDRVLRGEPAAPGVLDRGGAIGPLVRICVLLAATYGACMGVYGLFRADGPEVRNIIASAVKVPLLFVLTLVVTFPSLYVFNTLLGSRLRFGELLRLVVSALGVLTAVLAAFGPIVAFFSVTTTSYPFVLLLNVAVFGASGLFGLAFFVKTLRKLGQDRTSVEFVQPHSEVSSEAESPPVPPRAWLAVPPAGISPIFYIWMILFGVVGAQMGWVLRPFVGSPHLPFAWFRPRESSFFEAVGKSLRMLFGG